MHFDVPAEGARGPVPARWEPLSIGKAVMRRPGTDVNIVSVGVGVHRALKAAQALEAEGISVGVLDLRSIAPLDENAVRDAATQTGRLLVVDEDYQGFGLSGEIAALVLEAGMTCRFARVCTRTTIPYARHLEDQCLPSIERICAGARQLL